MMTKSHAPHKYHKWVSDRIARKIFLSPDAAFVIADRYNISEKTVENIRTRATRASATAGLKPPNRRTLSNRRRRLTAAQVRAVFTDTCSAAAASEKYGLSRRTVKAIRRRERRSDVTKDLIRDKTTSPVLTAELVRRIYQADGTHDEIAAAVGTTRGTVTRIRDRSRNAALTESLGPPGGRGPLRLEDVASYTPDAIALMRAWHEQMISRTTNPDDPLYEKIGGCGIKVCHTWATRPEKFMDWCRRQPENLTEPGLELVRLDRTKNYGPDTCIIS